MTTIVCSRRMMAADKRVSSVLFRWFVAKIKVAKSDRDKEKSTARVVPLRAFLTPYRFDSRHLLCNELTDQGTSMPMFRTTKLFRVRGSIIGVCGGMERCLHFIAWRRKPKKAALRACL